MGKEHLTAQSISDVDIQHVDRGIILQQNWHNVRKIFSQLVSHRSPQTEWHIKENLRLVMDSIQHSPNDNPKLEGIKRHFNVFDQRTSVNFFARNKKPYILEIHDDDEQEKEISERTCLERASFAKYVSIKLEPKHDEYKINFKALAKRLDGIVSQDNPEQSGTNMLTHFQENTHYAPYILGKSGEFSVSLFISGVREERTKENDAVMKFTSDDRRYPPRLSAEIIEGHWTLLNNKRNVDQIEYVVDPEKKAKMMEISQSIAKVFSSQG